MIVGILGGGQLGRMLALAGYPLGLTFRFFDPSALSPVAPLAELWAHAFDDKESLARFADGVDVLTYEFENVPVEAARELAQRCPLYPSPEALQHSQDRLVEKALLQELGVPVPPFVAVDSRADLYQAVAALGLPAVLKTRRMGYDGKGQAVLRTPEDLPRAWEALGGTPLILEGFVPFTREVSLISVRGRNGEIRFYPLVENHHREGILRLSLAPAPGPIAELQAEAEGHATRVLERLNYVGVLAIEFFERDGHLLANEMAPRVHNSGHWTIEGAETGQFENHLRAILGLPLGSTALRGLSAMVNIIGDAPDAAAVLAVPGAHLHLYGKAPRAGRKIGHVTLRADDPDTLQTHLSELQLLIP